MGIIVGYNSKKGASSELTGEISRLNQQLNEVSTNYSNLKSDISEALQDKGLSGDNYSELISLLQTKFNLDNILIPYENTTVYDSTKTAHSIVYSKYVGIVGEVNGLEIEYDLKDWNTLFINSNYDNTKMPKPVALWVNYNGTHFRMYLSEYQGPLYDVSGTAQITNTYILRMAHSMYNYTCTSTTTSGSNSCLAVGHGVAGKYNSNTWSSNLSNGIVTLISNNTGRQFTFRKETNDGTTYNSWSVIYSDNAHRLRATDMLWANCEWLRDRHAICSGISTNEMNGTVTTVDILNSSGNLANVGEDMYFWIKGTNSGLLAKYNLNTINNNQNLALFTFTLETSDAIYAKLVANGINMNDTGINSSSKPILVPGAKGAEAVAVDGYWYITTPIITYSSTSFSNITNIQDAPCIYYFKSINKYSGNLFDLLLYLSRRTTVFLALMTELITYNKFNSIRNFALDFEVCWSSFRSSLNASWSVFSSGTLYSYGLYVQCVVVPVVDIED